MDAAKDPALERLGGTRMYKQMIIAAAGGLVSAILSLGLLTGSSGALLFAYFAPLPLLLIGLSFGLMGVSAAIFAALIVVVNLAGAAQTAIFTASIALPAWLRTRYATAQRAGAGGAQAAYTPGDILTRIAVGGGLLLLLAALATSNTEGGFQGWVENFVNRMLGARLSGSGIEPALFAERLTPLFPAITALSWLVMVIINAALAQSILRRAGKSQRAAIPYAQTAIPEWFYWVFVAAAATSLVASGSVEYLSRNLAIIFAAPFMFVGLGVFHTLSRRVSAPGMALTALYVFLILFSWAGVFVAGLGFLEPWVRLRERFAKQQPPGTDTEEE
jgi:hypothetical protein